MLEVRLVDMRHVWGGHGWWTPARVAALTGRRETGFDALWGDEGRAKEGNYSEDRNEVDL